MSDGGGMTRWEQRAWRILGLPFDGEGDVDIRYRHRKSMLVLNAYATVLFASALLVTHLVVGPKLLGVIELLLCGFFLANLVWLRKHRNTTLSASIAAGLTLIGMVAGVGLYDGFLSPSMDLFQLTPLVAVAVWGHRVAAYTVVVTGLIVVGLWWLLPSGVTFDVVTELSGRSLAYRLFTLLSVVTLLEMISLERLMVRVLVDRTHGALIATSSRSMDGASIGHAQHLATLSQLASGVRHEMNTPLTAAMGQLELAMEATRAGADSTEMLSDSRESLTTIVNLVANLRAYSIGATEQRARASLHDAAQAALKLMDNDLRHRAVLHVDLQAGLLARGDTALWTDVFIGLLSNVRDSIEPGSAEQNEIGVSLGTADGGTEIVVGYTCNAGVPGIRPALHARLEDMEGGGLGLVLSRVLAADLGGTLTVDESPDGRSVTFRMWLPVRSSSA